MEQTNQSKWIEIIQKILKAFLEDKPWVTELLFTEGNRVSYFENGEWKIYSFQPELGTISDMDIDNFQTQLLRQKSGWMSEAASQKYLEQKIKKLNEFGSLAYPAVIEGKNLRMTWSLSGDKTFFRVRVLPVNIKKPAEYGVPEVVEKELCKFKGGGLIVVSGPPGSWKSTTINALVQDLINTTVVNVITLEDPVEYVYKTKATQMPVEQRELGTNFPTYEDGIATARTQSPQIIIVQELRTPEVIRAAISLMKAGVLVITTLHSIDTSSIFKNIEEAYPVEERDAIRSELKNYFKVFVSQRLVPSLDNTRVAVFEVLVNTNEVQGFLEDGRIQNLHQIMQRSPHTSFESDFSTKVKLGKLSREEAIAHCPVSSRERLIEILGR